MDEIYGGVYFAKLGYYPLPGLISPLCYQALEDYGALSQV